MNPVISLSKQYSLAIFCVLTIALTFAATLLPLLGEMIPVVIIFIPAFMAISLTVCQAPDPRSWPHTATQSARTLSAGHWFE